MGGTFAAGRTLRRRSSPAAFGTNPPGVEGVPNVAAPRIVTPDGILRRPPAAHGTQDFDSSDLRA